MYKITGSDKGYPLMKIIKPRTMFQFTKSSVNIGYGDWVVKRENELINIKEIIKSLALKDYEDIFNSVSELEKY